ncbi:MAG: 50S ribosomal protein L5 [Patescibacteria group bacterium]
MKRLFEQYKEKVIPALKEKFGYKNEMQVPKLAKVSINVGIGRGLKDNDYLESVKKSLQRITGQQPVETKAKTSISNFKIREGMVVGVRVTLRGWRMYDFIEKLVNITLPRVRDFRGLDPDNFDGHGNYSIGFKEHIAFPEIRSDELENIHGLEVNITTTADTDEEGYELLKLMGFPFKEKDNK